jgi:glycerophosphoryl diester phosphodiesterase
MNSIATAGAKDHAQRYHGVEIDIVLTRDGHPVLSHDPWVHTTLCRTASGEPIGERILIRDLTLAELQAQFICGGIADMDFPQVVPNGETIMTLDEVLDALKSAPKMVLYLDV